MAVVGQEEGNSGFDAPSLALRRDLILSRGVRESRRDFGGTTVVQCGLLARDIERKNVALPRVRAHPLYRRLQTRSLSCPTQTWVQPRVALIGVERRSLYRDKRDVRIMPAMETAIPRTRTSEARVMKNTGEGIVDGFYSLVLSRLIQMVSSKKL